MESNGTTRREMLKGVGLVGAEALLGSGLTTPVGARRESGIAQGAGSERPWYELGIIGEEPIMDNQLLWYLSHTGPGMADIGECLDTASRIDVADAYSWPKEWLKTAGRVRKLVEISLVKGHTRSAGEAYLRAANYYRAALIHHPEPKDSGVVHAGRQSVACFDKALELLSIPAQPIRIPYERTTLPGYFFPSPVARGEAPALIAHQGRDAWPEETMWAVDGATKRGYHCLIFHGPGQGMAIREQGLTFRPDWENVVSPVVDFSLKLPGVEPEGIILMGLSMGGARASGSRLRETYQDLHRRSGGFELGRGHLRALRGLRTPQAPRGQSSSFQHGRRGPDQDLADGPVVVQGRRVEARRHLAGRSDDEAQGVQQRRNCGPDRLPGAHHGRHGRRVHRWSGKETLRRPAVTEGVHAVHQGGHRTRPLPGWGAYRREPADVRLAGRGDLANDKGRKRAI
jgi:hypothetical protein